MPNRGGMEMDGLELEQKTPRRTRRWRIWAAAALLLALVAAGLLYHSLSAPPKENGKTNYEGPAVAPWSEQWFLRRYYSWRCFGNWKAWQIQD